MITDDFGRTIPIEANINLVQTQDRYEERILNDPLLEEMREAGFMGESTQLSLNH